MRAFLTPVPNVHSRTPADPDAVRYIRSYLILRTAVGVLGVALPFALGLVDGVVFDGSPFPRTSLSAYYYSGVRELFVGALCAIGVFLITYKVAEVNLDNTLSTVAGVAAVMVALFPTSRPDDAIVLTPLQDKLGETAVAVVHFSSAAVFIAALAAVSFFFGRREGRRPRGPGRRTPRFWRDFHHACAAIIVLALVWCAITYFGEVGPARALLYGESVAVFAFGASWLGKGLELETLRG